MTSEQAALALAEWAASVLPELGGAYTFVPAEKPQALPDVVVEVTRTVVTIDGAEGFAEIRLQQRMIVVHEVSLAFMVNNGDPKAAAETLRDFQSRLMDAYLSDVTLGQRVPFRSPLAEFDYTTPFVEYEDGTKGREMTMAVAVGNLVEAD